MSTATLIWKTWEGLAVDGKFPLRQLLGSSAHSAVFLTERSGKESGRVAIKLISADSIGVNHVAEDVQLSRWGTGARLSHPHLIRLFECGRCQIEDRRLLYVLMEFAEEDLAQILPIRALAAEEVSELLPPTLEAVSYLHRAGFAHGRLKPANIMAVDNQLRISADGLRKPGERSEARRSSPYDAPELATSGAAPETDVWSLGMMLVALFTQREPEPKAQIKSAGFRAVGVPESIPEPFREIAQRCLIVDPRQRCTVSEILDRLQPTPQARARGIESKSKNPQPSSRRWGGIAIAFAVFLLALWAGARLWKPHIPAETIHESAKKDSAGPEPSFSPSPLPPATKTPLAQPAQTGGAVLRQVLPEISRSAQNTITGKIKVTVQVAVDASGNVSQATLTSAGPSKYFAARTLEAARQWKFDPPRAAGNATDSKWNLRFQLGRASTQVSPTEIKP